MIKQKTNWGVWFTIGLFIFCQCDVNDENETVGYRDEMRNFIITISGYAKSQHPDFLIIPQNGQELLTSNGSASGTIYSDYIEAIDATAREDLLFGYDSDNQESPADFTHEMTVLCNTFMENGKNVLVIDYCWTEANIDSSFAQNDQNRFVSFAAPERELNTIPSYPPVPFHNNYEAIDSMASVKNFLYLINSENYETKARFIEAVSATNYDLVVMDLFHFEEAFTKDEISQLQQKPNGNRRLVISYMSIGEAETYRYYWNESWEKNRPDWLCDENPEWEGDFKVRYWSQEWQGIIYGQTNSYLDRILSVGFDGVWLDIVDAFEYSED